MRRQDTCTNVLSVCPLKGILNLLPKVNTDYIRQAEVMNTDKKTNKISVCVLTKTNNM